MLLIDTWQVESEISPSPNINKKQLTYLSKSQYIPSFS